MMVDQGLLTIKKDQLWQLAERFIDINDIFSSENVYQSDNVIEEAYDFLDNMCEIVGFKPYEEEE